MSKTQEKAFPGPDARDGPLPPLLVLLTFVTGLVDAFGFLALGRIFVANMTGNVVFIAFGLVGAPGFSIYASLTALVGFLVGSLGGGALGSRTGGNRGRLLGTSAAIQALFMALSLLLALLSTSPVSGAYLYGLTLLLAVAMGLQNACARRLAVPDLTTTVLTLTIVGIVADSHLMGGTGSRAGRRVTSVASMFMGAAVGALLVLRSSTVYLLVLVLGVVALVAIVALASSSNNPPWVQPR